MPEVTMDLIHALNERVALIEQRLLGGTESFAEHRKEIRDLRKQVSDLRDIMVELAGRDGTGGTIAALSDMANAYKDGLEKLEADFAAKMPDMKALSDVPSQVATLRQVFWKLGFVALGASALSSTLVTIALHFWLK